MEYPVLKEVGIENQPAGIRCRARLIGQLIHVVALATLDDVGRTVVDKQVSGCTTEKISDIRIQGFRQVGWAPNGNQ